MAQQKGSNKPPLTGSSLVLLTVGVALATFMEVLDISIVNVSVRSISGNLGVSRSDGTMAISAYSMGSAIMQPLTGWIAQRFGQVRTFSYSLTLFVLLSVLCGLSNSMGMLIVFRLLQGVVSGPMVPLSQTLLLNNYPPERRSIAMALWAMTVVVAPVFGPILGGWITDNYHWSWIFFINIPVGVFAILITQILLKDRESKVAKVPVDAIGLFLLAVGIGCLQFMLDKGNDFDWFSSKRIVALSIISLVCLTFLIAWELMHENPVVDLRLFAQRNFAAGVFCLALGMFAFFGGTVLVPDWTQDVMQYDATWAGFAVAPVGLLAIIVSPLVGQFQDRFDLRMLNTVGFMIFAGCSFWMSGMNTDIDFLHLALPRFFMGVGIALFFVPVNQIILAGIKPDRVADASGLSNFFRTLATSVSTAVSTTLYSHRGIYHHAILSEHTSKDGRNTSEYLNQLQQVSLQGTSADAANGVSGNSAYAAMNQVVNMQAQTLAINDVFWMFGIMFCLAMVVIWFAKPTTGTSGGGGH